MMYKNDNIIKRYSESFKIKILDELTTGKLKKTNYINSTELTLLPSTNGLGNTNVKT